MCDFDKGFILCTCKDKEKPIVHNKNSRRYKQEQPMIPKVYRWYLSTFKRYKSDDEPLMEGLYELPAADIGKGLTDEWVLLNLNYRNCFDVDYTPQEGDNLVIQDAHKEWVYLSFIFQNGGWERGHYDPFDTVQTLTMNGEVKQVGSH
ncbi:hypothetical protein H6G33_31345 [Calothrix sp. FACHB-1219]|nr:hypothetical protein [Calothrix sp. FACHB-168]MBD2221467.1 hypothetical protein [Calothrix sp. FACHB-1219]